MKRRRALVFADAVVGLALITVIAGLLAVAVNRHQAAMNQLANSRAASRLAQSALISLERGRPLPNDPRLAMRVLPSPANGPPIEGTRWIEIRATVNGQTEQFVALARKEESR
jgi:hypothetical protein